MSIIDRIKSRFLQRTDEKTESVVPQGSVWQVYLHPEEYNRKTRRGVGLRRPVGLLSEQHLGLTVYDDPAGLVPRYVRRHRAALTGRHTRRNRRHTARIMRALKPLDIVA